MLVIDVWVTIAVRSGRVGRSLVVTWRQHSGNFENPINPEYEQEARLVEQARAGSERAFSALLARYQQPVFRLIFYLVGEEEDARDLARIALKHALLHMPRVPSGFSIRPWLLRVAVLVALDAVRERSESPQQLLQSMQLPTPQQTPKIVDADPTMDDTMVLGVAVRHLAQNPANAIADAWDALPIAIERELIRRLLSGLPEGDAELLALGVVGQVPTRDLAALAGTSQRSIRRRIARALILFQGRYHEVRQEALPSGPAAPELTRMAGASPLDAARRGLAQATDRVRRGFQGAQVETNTIDAQERLETLRLSDIPAAVTVAAASEAPAVRLQRDADLPPTSPSAMHSDLTSADTIVTTTNAEDGLSGTFDTASWDNWTAAPPTLETADLATVALPVIAAEEVTPPTVHDMPTEVLVVPSVMAMADLVHNHLEATSAEPFFAEPLNSLVEEAPLDLAVPLDEDPGATMVAARFTLADPDQQITEEDAHTGPLALPENEEPAAEANALLADPDVFDEPALQAESDMLVESDMLAELDISDDQAVDDTFAASAPAVDEAVATLTAPSAEAPTESVVQDDQAIDAPEFDQAHAADEPELAAAESEAPLAVETPTYADAGETEPQDEAPLTAETDPVAALAETPMSAEVPAAEPLPVEPIFAESTLPEGTPDLEAADPVAALTELTDVPAKDLAEMDNPVLVAVAEEAQAAPSAEPSAQDTPLAPIAVEPALASTIAEPPVAEPTVAEPAAAEPISEETLPEEPTAEEQPIPGEITADEGVTPIDPAASDDDAARSVPEPTPAAMPQRSGNTLVMAPTQRADYVARHRPAWVEAGDLSGFAGVSLAAESADETTEFAAPTVPSSGVYTLSEPAAISNAQGLATNHFAPNDSTADSVTFDLADLGHVASSAMIPDDGALVPVAIGPPEAAADPTPIPASASTPDIPDAEPAPVESPPGLRTRTPTRPMPRLERDVTDPPHEW